MYIIIYCLIIIEQNSKYKKIVLYVKTIIIHNSFCIIFVYVFSNITLNFIVTSV